MSLYIYFQTPYICNRICWHSCWLWFMLSSINFEKGDLQLSENFSSAFLSLLFCTFLLFIGIFLLINILLFLLLVLWTSLMLYRILAWKTCVDNTPKDFLFFLRSSKHDTPTNKQSVLALVNTRRRDYWNIFKKSSPTHTV